MSDSDKSVGYGISADPSAFVEGMNKAAESAKNAAGNINSNFKKVQESFEQVQKQLTILASIVAGGSFFKEAISESNKMTGEVMKLSKMLGITGEEANALNTALGDIYSSSDDYIDAFTKFARQLKSNEAGLQAMGIQTRDANGHLRDSNTLFTESVQSVSTYKAGLDQNTYAQTLFGKSIDDVMKLQKLNNGVLEDAKKKNEELGLTVTTANVAASKEYKAAMNDVGDVLTAVKKTIGDAVMPVFTEMGQYFAETGPYVVSVFKGSMMVLLGAFELVKATVKTVAGAIFESINLIIDGAGLLGDVFGKLFKGDFSGAYESAKQLGARSAQAWVGAFSNFIESGNEAEDATRKHFDRLYSNQAEAPGAPKTGKKQMGDFGASNGKEKTAMAGWEAQLAEAKLSYQEQNNAAGTFYQFSKEQEVKFWRERLAQTSAGSADNLAVRRKLAEAQLAINTESYNTELAKLQTQEAAYKNNMTAKLAILDQEAALVKQRYGTDSKEYEAVQKQIVEAKRQSVEQLKQIDLARAQSAREAALDELTAHEQMAQLDRQVGVITQQELLTQQAAFEMQKTAIQMEALNERLRIAELDPDKNIVETNRIHQEIEQAESQHQLRMATIRNQAALETKQYGLDAMNTLGSGIQNVIAKALQGTMSLRGIMQGLWQAMTQAVTSALAKMAAEWLLTQLKLMIFGKVAAVSSVAEKAAEAGAGGVASMAAAPWPLNMSAPLFGAAMMASAMAYAPVAASAAGGYDIPSTINPLTQLHASEMVLPAKHADVIRSLADDGQGSGAGGASSAPIQIYATGGEFIHKNDLAKLLQKMNRNFEFVR